MVRYNLRSNVDSHTVHGRPTRKDGVVIYERIFRNRSFCELKITRESHDLAKILLESNQNSNELSMNRKYEQWARWRVIWFWMLRWRSRWPKSIGHFEKYHNTLCLSLQNFCINKCFHFLLGLTMVPRENKSNTDLCKSLEDKQRDQKKRPKKPEYRPLKWIVV